jgi:hypothetical protein
MTVRSIAEVLKGGSGSGNFGHSGRPGERGGSSANADSPGFLVRETASHADTERANNKAYIRKLERNHGLKVEASKNADPVDVLSVHETLSVMPNRFKGWMKEAGVSVRVVSNKDETPRSFRVGSQTFVEGGHANYVTKEIVIRTGDSGSNYSGVSRITSHEAGHFGVAALASVAAAENVQVQRLEKNIEGLHKDIYRADEETQNELSRKINDLRKEQRLISTKGIGGAMKKFDEASKLEGGVTPYSDSYVRDKTKGWSRDTWEYKSTLDETVGHSGITRAGNENFAEIMGKLYLNVGSSRKLNLSMLKEGKPKTYKYFKKLHSVLRVQKINDFARFN